MRVGWAIAPTQARSHRHDAARLGDASCLRFGDEILVLASDASWEDVRARAADNGYELEERPAARNDDGPYLVTQVGDLFQRANPDVRVLFDKGRYLVVDPDRKQAERLRSSPAEGYAVRQVHGSDVVFEVRAPAARRAGRTAWINELVSKLSPTRARASLEK